MAKLVFADKKAPAAPMRAGWTVLIVDDDPEVHAITELALRGLCFQDRAVVFLHAHSGTEAREILARTADVALILLDVVMETDDAGLRLIDHVRTKMNNHKVRIVLRTGQPGQAPEHDVILRYDINDYKSKTELTQQKLFTTVITALRGYRDLLAIESGRQGLRRIINASASLMQARSLRMFASGVLTHLGGLVGGNGCGILCTRPGFNNNADDLAVIAATGRFEPLMTAAGDMTDEGGAMLARIGAVLHRRQSESTAADTILYLRTPNRRDVAIYVESDRPLDAIDRALLEVFGSNISVGFDNIEMIDRIIRDNEMLERRVAERTRDLRERETRLRAILETSPVAVAILPSSDAPPVFVNSRFLNMLATAGTDGPPPCLSALFADRADFERVASGLGTVCGGTIDIEARIRRQDGTTFWGLLSARWLEVESRPCALIWLHDINDRKQVESELRQRATTDALTGVANRRHFLDRAAEAFVRARQNNRPLAVLMADIDDFKRINDTHGHPVGDRAIRAFTTTVQTCLRTHDLIGRLGGEEFAIILPDTRADEAEQVAERIRATVATVTVPLTGGKDQSLTASFGCTALTAEDPSVDVMLARADQAMYLAKDAGRNRVRRA